MDRRLVLTNEGARHPFRRSLPPPPPLLAAPPTRAREDAKLFLLSFSAFFTCFYTLIA
jgi:hypothetical protein